MQLESEPIHDSNRYPDSLCVMLQCWIKSTQSTQLQLHLRCKLQQFKDSSSGITPTPGISSLSMSSLIPVSPNFRRLEGPKLAHLPFHEDIKHFGSWRLPQDWGFTSTLELLGLCVQGLRASRVLSVLPNTLTQVQAGREHRILLLLHWLRPKPARLVISSTKLSAVGSRRCSGTLEAAAPTHTTQPRTGLAFGV